MQIQIQFISADVEDKGKYKMAEIAYKDLAKGQVASKKLLSFTNPAVYKTMVDAKKGEVYNVELIKNDKGYWDWTAVATSTSVSTTDAVASKPSGASASPKSTYETAEERAQRQVLIVRQSAIAQAVATATVGAKGKVQVEDVLQIAGTYYDWVFGNTPEPVPLSKLPVLDTDEDIPM